MVNSHIQMPKQVMKNFVNEHGQIFYYDFEKEKIGKGYPKSLYTEIGYYSDYVEDFLGAEIESELGELLTFLKNTKFELGEEPPAAYVDIAFRYIYSLIARSPSLQKEISANSVFYQFLTEIDRHDLAAHDAYLMAKERNIFQQYRISFLDNRSLENLVLPTGGITQCKKRLFCPVSPQRAIVLDDIKMEQDEKKRIVVVYEIDDFDTIHQINCLSFRQEMTRDSKYIISDNRDLIIGLAKDYNLRI